MMERKLKNALKRQTPDVLEAVLSECKEHNEKWQIVKPPQKRRPWLGIACAAAVVAFVVSLSLLALRKPTEPNATGLPTETTEPPKTIAPIEDKQIVTDAYQGSWEGYKYAIPKLNIDSRYAERVNEDIAQSYVLDEDGVLREYSDRSYEYHVEGDILSLVYYLHDNIWVYTLNLSDGSEATRDEVLLQADVTLQDYLSTVVWNLGNTCCTLLPQQELEAYVAAPNYAPLPVCNALWETLIRSNTDSTQPFFTEDGLFFVGDVYDLEDSQRIIFRYDEPVGEAAYYQAMLKYAAFDEGMICTIYDGACAPNGGRIHKQIIPCVLFRSDYAEEVNREIWALCSPYMDDDGQIRSNVDISFQSSKFIDVFSLQLIVQDENEDITYRAYNFDMSSGNKVEEADLLSFFDLTVDEFNASILRSLGNFSCSFSGEEMEQYVDTVGPDFAKSVAPENIEAAVPLVLGDELYVIGTVYYSGTERMVYFQYDNPAPESPYLEIMLSLYQIHLPNQAITPVDPDNPVVEAYANSAPFRYEDVDYVFKCSIPKIQSESAYAQKVNQELADYYNSNIKSDGTWGGANVSYEYYINGDILSLIVYLFDTEHRLNFEYGQPNRIYNIRISDGSEVTSDEILQHAGVTKEAFRARASEFLGTYYLWFLQDSTLKEILEDPDGNADSSSLAWFIATVSEDNLDQVVAYLTANGELHLTGDVYVPTGGFAIETAMSSFFEDFEVSPYYENMLKLCEE